MSKRLMRNILHTTNKSFVRRPILWTIPIVLLTVLVFVSVSTLFPGVYGPKANGVNSSKAPARSDGAPATPTQAVDQINSSAVVSSPETETNGNSQQSSSQTPDTATDFRSQAADVGRGLDDINARLDRGSHRSLEAYKTDIRGAQAAIKDARQAVQSLNRNRDAGTVQGRQTQQLLDDYTNKLSLAIQSYNNWIGSGSPVDYAHAEEQRAVAHVAGVSFYSNLGNR